MMRSLYSGVSGLKNHQVRMDVIGHNVANVNTHGYKSERVNFMDMISQELSGASEPKENIGGINPMQVGLGSMISSIDKIMTQGSLQTTGKNTDVAISGEGFFVIRDGDRQFYTRTNLNKDVIDEFNSVVTQYYKAGEAAAHGVLTVKQCADSLNLSTSYLSDLIKAETGMSAKSHIQEYVIQLAKTKLLGTNETISEIAYSLGFEYPQGFNKLFKSKVGQSPSAYRNVN